MWAASAFPVLNFEFSRSWLCPTLRFFYEVRASKGEKRVFEGWETISKQSLVWLDISGRDWTKRKRAKKVKEKHSKLRRRTFFYFAKGWNPLGTFRSPIFRFQKYFCIADIFRYAFAFVERGWTDTILKVGRGPPLSQLEKELKQWNFEWADKKGKESQIISPHLHGQMDQYPRLIKTPIRPRDLGESWN